MNVQERVVKLLVEVLELDPATHVLTPDTPLFESLPELDSLGVVSVLQEIETRFDVVVEDEEVDGDLFETVGSLVRFVEAKLAA